MKPRVMSLVVFTGAAGLIVAPGSLHPVLAAVAVLCIAVAAGASAAITMGDERNIYALMTRTRNRPLPTGRVEPAEALTLGAMLSLFSVMFMGLALNWVAAGLLALAIGFYVFVYTIWLKRRTPQNIVIRGARRAFETYGERGRAAAFPADDRLGGGDWRCQPCLDRLVCADLLLDAAAFLGARAGQVRRLRARRGADAARGCRGAGD